MLTSRVAWMNRISRKVVLLFVMALLHRMPFAGTASAISPAPKPYKGLEADPARA